MEAEWLETAYGEIMNNEEPAASPEEQLSRIFGGYRAEWLKQNILYPLTEAHLFPGIEDPAPLRPRWRPRHRKDNSAKGSFI